MYYVGFNYVRISFLNDAKLFAYLSSSKALVFWQRNITGNTPKQVVS